MPHAHTLIYESLCGTPEGQSAETREKTNLREYTPSDAGNNLASERAQCTLQHHQQRESGEPNCWLQNSSNYPKVPLDE